jgi:hypothetical protein
MNIKQSSKWTYQSQCCCRATNALWTVTIHNPHVVAKQQTWVPHHRGRTNTKCVYHVRIQNTQDQQRTTTSTCTERAITPLHSLLAIALWNHSHMDRPELSCESHKTTALSFGILVNVQTLDISLPIWHNKYDKLSQSNLLSPDIASRWKTSSNTTTDIVYHTRSHCVHIKLSLHRSITLN